MNIIVQKIQGYLHEQLTRKGPFKTLHNTIEFKGGMSIVQIKYNGAPGIVLRFTSFAEELVGLSTIHDLRVVSVAITNLQPLKVGLETGKLENSPSGEFTYWDADYSFAGVVNRYSDDSFQLLLLFTTSDNSYFGKVDLSGQDMNTLLQLVSG